MLDADAAARLATDGVLIDVRVPNAFAVRSSRSIPSPATFLVPSTCRRPATSGLMAGFLMARRWRADSSQSVSADGKPVGAYCGSGVNAAHTVFAMTLAGLPTPALYVGSWSNWIADGTRPIAAGAD